MVNASHVNERPIRRLEADLALERPVSVVEQVSSARAAVLSGLGVRTVRDLVSFFPFRYIDLSRMSTIAQARIGDEVTLAGTVHEVKLKRPKPRLSLVEITLLDPSGTLLITCFRQPWMAEKIKEGMRITASGKVTFEYGFKRLTNPIIEVLTDEGEAAGFVVPVYHATESLSTAWIRRLVGNALELTRGMNDPLPLELRTRYRLISRNSAFTCIHLPADMREVHQAHRRLVYEELLFLELFLMTEARRRLQGKTPCSHVCDGRHMAALNEVLPFTLTAEQVTARDELLTALGASHVARHMILGDVGTGKTILAAFGFAAAADSGTQALCMAPTEVLANQYGEKLGPVLDAAGITWELLTGSTSPERRAAVLKAASAGSVDVLFGTQALLEDDVVLPHVSLVVIDEQQRFGVAQRERLIAKGEAPDVLSMTATPIPRSLALAVYGDMTLSYLTRRPRNTAGNTTRVLDREQAGIAYDAVREAITAGQRAYVVCPLVGVPKTDEKQGESVLSGENEESFLPDDAVTIESDADLAALDATAATTHARYLQRQVFPDARVEVLHGRMSGEEKQATMARFASGATDVLVATTVIEVGVDVPEATVMVIEDADRFGLAQLHQLRGRVGRGSVPGQVFLLSNTRAPVALRRLSAMEKTEDGFALSEFDLSLRREGDILGNRQHGASTLRLVNIIRDKAVIEAAHADARQIMEEDPLLQAPDHRGLAHEMSVMFTSGETEEQR